MCGRYVLSIRPEALAAHFGLDEYSDYPPRWNISPGTEIPVIRLSPEGRRVLHLLRWGLVPNWAKDASIGHRLNNARAEISPFPAESMQAWPVHPRVSKASEDGPELIDPLAT